MHFLRIREVKKLYISLTEEESMGAQRNEGKGKRRKSKDFPRLKR